MSTQLQFSSRTTVSENRTRPAVTPSILSDEFSQPFSLEQELTPFGTWTGKPIWVPPKDAARDMAKTMLDRCGLFRSKEDSWSEVADAHRSSFTQVREIELAKASIRLPQGRVYVSVTEEANFDTITDKIPDCVKTRLEEFKQGPGRRHGTKIYYLKPLCVEVGNDLIFTTTQELEATIARIQEEVFANFRRMYVTHRMRASALEVADLLMAVPRAIVRGKHERQQRKIDAYQAKLEFKRRQLALDTVDLHRRFRTDGCQYDEILSLTNPLERRDVIERYGIDHELPQRKRDRLLMASAVSLPWFLCVPIAFYYASAAITLALAPPVVVCDPAFVAEMPGSNGVLLKIGHFDEVGGVMHVEI